MNFDHIEDSLSIKLPDSYKSICERNPFAEYESEDPLSLIFDESWLISKNNEYRAQGYCGRDWPSNFFSFGRDGTGGIYFMVLREILWKA